MDFSNFETVQDFGMLLQWEKDRELCFFAAKNDLNSVRKVALLITAGANINYQSTATNLTPLILAATTGHISTMELLIQAGAQLSTSTINHDSPLSRAVFYKFFDKAFLLYSNMSENDLATEIKLNNLRIQKNNEIGDAIYHSVCKSNPCLANIHPETLFTLFATQKKLELNKPLIFSPIYSSQNPEKTIQPVCENAAPLAVSKQQKVPR